MHFLLREHHAQHAGQLSDYVVYVLQMKDLLVLLLLPFAPVVAVHSDSVDLDADAGNFHKPGTGHRVAMDH